MKKYTKDEVLKNIESVLKNDLTDINAKQHLETVKMIVSDFSTDFEIYYLEKLGETLEKYIKSITDLAATPENIADANKILDETLFSIIQDEIKNSKVNNLFYEFEEKLKAANKQCKDAEKKIMYFYVDFAGDLRNIDNQIGLLSSIFEKIKNETDKNHDSRFKTISKKNTNIRNKVKNLKKDLIDEYNLRVDFINSFIKDQSLESDVINFGINEKLERIEYKSIENNSVNYEKVNSELVIKYYEFLMTKFSKLDSKEQLDIMTKLYILFELCGNINSSSTKDELEYVEARIKIIEELLKKNNFVLPSEFKSELEQVKNKINSLNNRTFDNDLDDSVCDINEIESRIKKINSKCKSVLFRGSLNKYQEELAELKVELDKLKRANKIENSKYESLVGEINHLMLDMELTISDDFEEKYDENTNKEEFIEKEIDKLSVSIDWLNEQLEKNKDKRVIKNLKLKSVVKIRIKKYMKLLENLHGKLNTYKDSSDINEEKYNTLLGKITSLEDKLKSISGGYKRRFPLKVISVREPKKKITRNKKIILYAVGITSFALLKPVLLPAIMYGNSILYHKIPILKTCLKALNDIILNLTPVSIEASMLAPTLLRGIAATVLGTGGVVMAGLATYSIVSTLVKDVKKLKDKIDMYELKYKISHSKPVNYVKQKTRDVKKIINGKTRSYAGGSL